MDPLRDNPGEQHESKPEAEIDSRSVYDPGEAARRLDLSSAGLRRLATIYERIHGALPRDRRAGRLWTDEAIERLSRARAMVQAGRSPSVEAALAADEAGDGVDPYPVPRRPGEANLAALLNELKGLRAAVERQNELLEDQGRRLEALEAPRDERQEAEDVPVGNSEGSSSPGEDTGEPEAGVERRSWWRRVFGGGD